MVVASLRGFCSYGGPRGDESLRCLGSQSPCCCGVPAVGSLLWGPCGLSVVVGSLLL